MKFLDPTSDYAFKKIFGNEQRKNLTISFLNSLLELPEGKRIVDLTFPATANLPEMQDKKQSFVDINCIDAQGRNYIIEMQISYQKSFLPRAQYYASFVLSRQLNVGIDYERLRPVIFIAILDHEQFEGKDYLHHHMIMNTKTGEIGLEHLQFHFVELPKFHKVESQLTNPIDQWIYFIKHAEDLDTVPHALQESEEIVEAFHVVEKALWTNSELEQYIINMDARGREQRIEQGAIERGIEKGKELTALNLLQLDVPHELVAQGTGLTLEQVKNLALQIKK